MNTAEWEEVGDFAVQKITTLLVGTALGTAESTNAMALVGVWVVINQL